MKRLGWLLFLFAATAFGQDAQPFADYTLMLVSPTQNVPAIVPVIKEQKLEYIPVNDIQAALNSGAVPVRLRQILEAFANTAAENQRLQAENQRLWKLVDNTTQQDKQPTVVVQSPPQPSAPSVEDQRRALVRQMLIQNMLRQNARPAYQLPQPIQMPQAPPATHCISNTSLGQTTTDCRQY